MATYNAGRTARLNALLAANPTTTATDIATFTGRSRKTVYMWIKGRPGSIPESVLTGLESHFDARAEARQKLDAEDLDLLG